MIERSSWKALLIGVAVIATASAQAQGQERHGDWFADPTGEFLEAFTTNDSGSQFGLLCRGRCLWYLEPQYRCNDGEGNYPVLINASGGATYLSMRCLHFRDRGKTRYIYFFEDFDKVDHLASAGSQIGFAMPLESGRFAVSRFSLNGLNEAKATLQRGQERSSFRFRDSTM